MSISKISIGNDLSTLKACLDNTGFFGSTSISGNELSVCDENDVVVIKITNSSTVWGFSVKIANGNFYDFSDITGVECDYAYTCANGIMLNLQGSNNYVPVIITKTNNNKYAIITNNHNGYAKNEGIAAVSCSDAEPINDFSYYRFSRSFTTMIPFNTETGTEVMSYTPYAYYIPFQGLNTVGYAKIIMNGCYYITDGYWAIKDEPA